MFVIFGQKWLIQGLDHWGSWVQSGKLGRGRARPGRVEKTGPGRARNNSDIIFWTKVRSRSMSVDWLFPEVL